LSDVFHASPADINVAQSTRLGEEYQLYNTARRFALAM
jgi:hypothetical protein